ncbi:hypothetical protein [Streptomyces griseofuscus]|uniref:hypothetical protein n=1 Tax=Streptomyces griseofuscus TaxID=146922 RepID=UPI003145293E
MHPFPAKLALVTAAAAALLAPVSSARAAAAAAPAGHAAAAPVVHRNLPEPPTDIVRKELGELIVVAPHPMTGYSPTKFPHWITQYGTCDTREVVLARDGEDVVHVVPRPGSRPGLRLTARS